MSEEKHSGPKSRFVGSADELVLLSAEEALEVKYFAKEGSSELSERFGLPREAEPFVLRLVADVIELAAAHGSDRWGLTDYKPYMRVNVGWTEIITTYSDSVRLIVNGDMALDADPEGSIELLEGKDDRGFYPSIRGSLAAEIWYEPLDEFLHAIAALRPALKEAVRLSARRPATPAIRKAHSNGLLVALSEAIGRELPKPREFR